MKNKLLQLAARTFSDEQITEALHEAGIDVERELAAMDDRVQKDPEDWEQIKNQPRKHSNIAAGKPREIAVGSIKGTRGKLPVYLEEQGDGQGVGGD